MQLYVGDYLADTLHLTTEQHGAYLLLLMTMWRHDAALPNDAAKLARIARVSPKRWPAIWSEIADFFTINGDAITNARLTKEHQKAVSISQERKTAGSKGGKANALKYINMHEANATARLKHSQISEPDIREEAKASPLPVTDDGAAAVAIYNEAAARSGWSQVQKMTKPRFSALKARMKDAGGLEGWHHAIERAEASDFLCGRKPTRDGAFFASFDFLTQSKSFTRLMEGTYDNRTQARDQQHHHSASGQRGIDPALENIARLVGLDEAQGYGRG